jgi:methyl-accepting chemotaxis protein
MSGLVQPHNAAAAPPQPATAEPQAHAALLQRWMALAAMQQQVIRALMGEVDGLSGYVETEAGALIERFQRLVVNARQQSQHVDQLTGLAAGIEFDGKRVPIIEIANLLTSTLGGVVEKILQLSKDTMTMVYVLDAIGANVESVRGCMDRLDRINRITNMLALNARIEAERAGSAGAAFRVVAGEVRDLSQSTQSLFNAMNGELNTMVEGVDGGKVTLKRVATIDLSDNILAKERLEQLLGALVKRGDNLETIVSDAVREAEMISEDIAAMVTRFQFQDRTTQRLKHVSDALAAIDEAIEEIKTDTQASAAALDMSSDPYSANVKRLLDRFTMSEVRDRFATQLNGGAPASGHPAADTADAGSVELF